MEDRVVAGTVRGLLLIGVFDGHGGSAVADHAVTHALAAVEESLATPTSVPAWDAVFARLDLDLTHCGATATLVLREGRTLSVAWVGDSRALLVGPDDWQVLTPDHRITRAAERERVLAAGAVLSPPYVMDPKSQQGLMVTRALGDRGLRGVGVIAHPEVTTIGVPATPSTCLVATDGLWDAVTNAEAALVCRHGTPQEAADNLVHLVRGRGGSDNVAVVVSRM